MASAKEIFPMQYSSFKDCVKENFHLTNVIKQKEKNE